jgi:hypothetical protein
VQIPLERFGKYEILRELGRGAMGAVYQAHPLFTWMVSSIKAEVKKKHFSCGWNFSCFSAHSIELVLF